MSAFERRCFAVAVVLGLIYLALLPFQPYPLSWLLKPIPMLLFAVLAWRAYPGKIGVCLAVGFVAAAAGDFFLDYGARDGLFIQALSAFLINQLAFIAGFALMARGKPWLRWRMLPVTLYSLLLVLWLVPAAGAYQIPVAIYLLCLYTMAFMACRVNDKVDMLWLGAMLFVIADSLIGINKFAQPFTYAIPVIVICYFTGQTLIVLGVVRLNGQVSALTK
ncbi:lysoplasmalogenase [Pseudomonas sp. OIL-1]|uniref:lysoplasmalogenase n=1 Tax=Pseudomonas sp. OIL-1 TaxID=2706126 RepID=UPI0013A75BD3|nr:lysoplasmalogenase [Pseudomonas sp. OIL-1]QIB50510.1 lysoplasmalogenase [Pseudomonas sp. OIL-1]